MLLRLSNTSVNPGLIQLVRWHIEESGIDRSDEFDKPVSWRRTYVYFRNTPEPLTLNDYSPNYESDIAKLEQALTPAL